MVRVHGNRRYDWEKWFLQERFTLRQNKEFSCAPSIMAQQVRNAASAHGLRVKIVWRKNGFTVNLVNTPVIPSDQEALFTISA